jgi:hypothetical protein
MGMGLAKIPTAGSSRSQNLSARSLSIPSAAAAILITTAAEVYYLYMSFGLLLCVHCRRLKLLFPTVKYLRSF